jgi:hypothetical protein
MPWFRCSQTSEATLGATSRSCRVDETDRPRRKVAEDLAIETLVAYVVLDAARRSMTVYGRDEGPQTFVRSGDGRGVRFSADLEV